MLQLTGEVNARSPWWERVQRSMSWIWPAAALCTTLLRHTPFVGERAFTVMYYSYSETNIRWTVQFFFDNPDFTQANSLSTEGKQTLTMVWKSNTKPLCKSHILLSTFIFIYSTVLNLQWSDKMYITIITSWVLSYTQLISEAKSLILCLLESFLSCQVYNYNF